MSRQTVAFFVTVVVVLAPQISQGDQNEEARIWFFAHFHESEKFITVVAAGNGSTRNAYLTVYEVLSDFKLRRLQSRFLIHKCHHTGDCLCGSGRFFITTNQSGFHERTNPLVVYDLVRNEYTAYAIEELFSQDQLRQIRRTRAPFISPNDDLNDDRNDDLNDDVVEWSQSLDKCESHFDAKQLSFTMYAEGPLDLQDWRKAPEFLKVEKPFISVVIDLPTRVAKAVACSETKDLRPTGTEPGNSYIRCDQEETIDDAIFDKSKNRILLPRLLNLNFMNPEGKKVYRLNAETQEYDPVDVSEWHDKKKGTALVLPTKK